MPAIKGRRFSRTFTRYVGWEIARTFLLVLLILELIHGAVFSIQAIREFDFGLILLFPIFWRTFAYALLHAVPIAILLASGLVYGRLVADREIAALRSFGISHVEMLLAPAGLGLLLGAVAYFINGYLVPEVRFSRRNVGRLILEQLKYLDEGHNKTFPLGQGGENVLWVQEYRDGKLLDILVFAQRPRAILGEPPGESGDSGKKEREPVESLAFPLVMHAREGEIVPQTRDGERRIVFELRGVHVFYDNDLYWRPAKNDFIQMARLSRLTIPLELDDKERGIKDMPTPMLREFIRERRETVERLRNLPGDQRQSIEAAQRGLSKARTVFHNRLTFALVCFTFPLTMALIALALNSSNSLLPFFLGSTVNCAVFFLLEIQGNALSMRWNFPWLEHLGNAGLLVLALALFLRLERVRLPGRRRGSSRAREGSGTGS